MYYITLTELKSPDGKPKSYGVESFTEDGTYVEFKTVSKKGKMIDHKIPISSIIEISNVPDK